jgi:hypothetical protein
MAINPTPVQVASQYAAAQGLSATATFGAGVSSGNLLVARVMVGGQNITYTVPTGWSLADQATSTGLNADIATAIFYTVVGSGGGAPAAGTTAFTFHWSVSHTAGIYIEEWHAAEAWATAPLDVHQNNTHTSASTSLDTGAAGTSTHAEEVWVAALAYKSGVQTINSIASGWTLADNSSNAGANSQASLYQVASGVGAVEATGTLASSAQLNSGVVAAFYTLPAVVVASTPAPRVHGQWPMAPLRTTQRTALTEGIFSAYAGVSEQDDVVAALEQFYGNGTQTLALTTPHGSWPNAPTRAGQRTIWYEHTIGGINNNDLSQYPVGVPREFYGLLYARPVVPSGPVTMVANSALVSAAQLVETSAVMVGNSVLAMGTPKILYPGAPYTCLIGGVAVSVVQGTLDVVNQIGQRSTGTIQVWSPLGTTWKYGTRVLIYDGANKLVYAGYTNKDKVTKQSRQGYGHLEHQVTLMDNCYRADKRLIFGEWENRTAGSIVKDLLSKVLAAEGVTITSASIATGPTIQEVVWNGKQVSSALTWLATQAGYWWNIDTQGVLWFQPYGGIPAPFVLDGTQVNIDTNLSVTFGNDMFVNRQFVKGAHAKTAEKTEGQVGDGHKQNFTLSYEVAELTTILVNGVPETVSTKGDTGSQWYFAVGDSVIAQDTGQVTLQNSDNLSVSYKGSFPILSLAQSPSLIASQKAREGGGTGYVENEYTDAKITSQQAAFQIAGGILSHYGADMTQLEFDVLASMAVGLNEGQMLTVNLPDFGLSNTQMLVTSVEITDSLNEMFSIWYHVLAVGSPYDAAQWQTYWQNLMNQESDPSDFSSIDDAGGLAFILSSNFNLTISAVGSVTKAVCPILPFTVPFTIC